MLSSVAAERPRRANAVYGASKAGLDALAQGLGDELHEQGVRILVVRPGFVHTRMTRGLAPAPLSDHAAGARARCRERTGPPPLSHRVGAIRSTLADARRAHAPPFPLSPPETVSATKPLNDMAHLRARRRQARRRRYLFRRDIGLALLIAVVALLLAPGVAIVAVAALLILAICGVSILLEQWRLRRR